ncbi:MAG: hypothetical protein GY801_05255 [bacterium]|nr:hypothetical protein [bacterium]
MTQPGNAMPAYPNSVTRQVKLTHEGLEFGYCEVIFSRRSIEEQVLAQIEDRVRFLLLVILAHGLI